MLPEGVRAHTHMVTHIHPFTSHAMQDVDIILIFFNTVLDDYIVHGKCLFQRDYNDSTS